MMHPKTQGVHSHKQEVSENGPENSGAIKKEKSLMSLINATESCESSSVELLLRR